MKVNKELENNGTVVIIHHNDRDGVLAASCVYLYIDSLPGLYKIRFISANYTKPIKDMVNDLNVSKEDINQIWVVDYSISNEKGAQGLIELNGICEGNLHWIDHHYSSLKYIADTNELCRKVLSEINGLRVNGISGCALTWIYTTYLKFMNDVSYSDKTELANRILTMVATEPDIYSAYYALKNISNTMNAVSPNIAKDLLEKLYAPELIIYAHRYDIWNIDRNVLLFSYGEHNYNPTDSNILDLLDMRRPGGSITKYIEDGKIIEDYINTQNKQYIDRYGFECMIDFIDMSKRGHRDQTTYSVFAMNTTNRTSLTFGDNMSRYDICIPFIFDGSKYTYSMYTNKNNINCAELCTILGGGGHPKAAGFSSEDLLVGKNKTFTIRKLN